MELPPISRMFHMRNFTFQRDLSPPFHSGTAAPRDGVCDRLKFKYKVK